MIPEIEFDSIQEYYEYVGSIYGKQFVENNRDILGVMYVASRNLIYDEEEYLQAVERHRRMKEFKESLTIERHPVG